MSKLAILAAFVSLTACAVDEPVDESTAESTLLSTCDDWGNDWGWSDPWGDSGFGFEAFAQPELSAFGCDDPWGGGGGGGQICGWPTSYDGNGVETFFGDPAFTRERARTLALRAAKQRCMSSGWVCTPQVDSFDVRDGGCVSTGNSYQGEDEYTCSATATVVCSYH